MTKSGGGRGGSATDSILLAAVKLMTVAGALVTTMVLAHRLSLDLYGTYAQANLVITVASTATILGLADAVNFFFNRESEPDRGRAFADTIFTLQIIIGIVSAAVIIIAGPLLVSYFDNALLAALWPYIALRPLLANIGLSLQVLTISVGKAKSIALRNAAFSVLKLLSAVVISGVTADLRVLLLALLVLDLLSAGWFWYTLVMAKVRVRVVLPRWRDTRAIFAFSIPMGIYVATSVFGREVDKVVIAAHFDAEWYAIYANAAIILPLDIVSSSFLVVMIPILTRYLSQRHLTDARDLFKHYLAVGYLTTATFALACLLVAPDLIQVLYGEKYLPGVDVFRLYLVSSILRFAAASLVLSASGRSRLLMYVSLATMVLSSFLSVLGFELLGFVGPAWAAVLVALIGTSAILGLSVRQLEARWTEVFDLRALAYFVVVSGALFALSFGGVSYLKGLVETPLSRVLIFAPAFVLISMALNFKQLSASLRAINSMR